MGKLWRLLVFAVAGLTGGRMPASVIDIDRALSEEKLDPKAAQELAGDRKIVVYNGSMASARELFARAYSATLEFNYNPEKLKKEHAFTVSHLKAQPFSDVCGIFLDKAHIKGPKESLSGFGMSADEIYRWVMLHEIRHCSKENDVMETSLEFETDSDVYATSAMLRSGAPARVAEAVILYRGYTLGGDDAEESHESALHLDALYHHRPMPSLKQIAKANKDAAGILKALKSHRLALRNGLCDKQKKRAICFYDAARDIRRLSPLAQRRVVLFQQALDVKLPMGKKR